MLRPVLAVSAAFKYKKFPSYRAARDWYMGTYEDIIKSADSLIHYTKQASDPFQFLSKAIENVKNHSERISILNNIPFSQDASASAYQIMSYLLLNKEMAIRTNLLSAPITGIQDFDQSLKNELKEFLQSDTNKYSIIDSMLTRKLAKQLFMPLIYVKTIRAMANDIRGAFGSLLSYKDYYSIADLSYEFWTKKDPDISNLMKLINLIGWFCSSLGKPVYYSTPYLTTVQDYMRSEKADIWVYDRANKKRRRVTLRVPTQNRDKRKTQVSTCVNFIHQKDAYIAMAVVNKLMTIKKMPPAPIYTVHENFVTTPIFKSTETVNWAPCTWL